MSLLLLACLFLPQDDAAVTEAITMFDSTMSKSKDSSARVAAVGNLAKIHHEKIVGRLGNVLSHDEKMLRVAAAQQLATFKDTPELTKSAAHALSSALSSGSNQKELEVQVALLTALGHLGEESSGTVLKSHFDDKEISTAQAAVIAAGDLKSKAMVEPLIEELRDCEKKSKMPESTGTGKSKPVKSPKGGGGGDAAPDPEAQKRTRAANLLPTCLQALGTLTGQQLTTGDEYEKWWSKNRNSFNPSK